MLFKNISNLSSLKKMAAKTHPVDRTKCKSESLIILLAHENKNKSIKLSKQ